jgi:hypothetical protein
MTDEIVIGGDSVDIPNATYPGTLVEVRTEKSKTWGDFRVWDFLITTTDGAEHRVSGATSMFTSKKSKPGRWIGALLGRYPEKGEAVNVIGKPCLVVVEENDDGWPKVTDVFPPMASTSAPAPAESPPSQPVAVGQTQISEELPF